MTSHTSLNPALSISQQTLAVPFTLAELKDELRRFIVAFDVATADLLTPAQGAGYYPADATPESARVDSSYLWISVIEMYDYGVQARIMSNRFSEKQAVDGIYADTELFIRGLESLRPYFEEKDVPWPRLSILTVRTAIARLVLEGGDRYTGYEDADADYLSIPELSLLADMDERSVRNAANPKLPDALKTISSGKRTLVERKEAKRWLSSRKGFIETQEPFNINKFMPADRPAPTSTVSLPSALAEKLTHLAEAADQPVAEFIQNLISAHTKAPK